MAVPFSMVMAPVGEGLHQCLCTVSRADRLPGSCIGDALPRQAQRVVEEGGELVKEARGPK
jgi:hypothetical protein